MTARTQALRQFKRIKRERGSLVMDLPQAQSGGYYAAESPYLSISH